MSGAPLFTLVIFMKVQHFITLLMFVLNFVLFFNLFTLLVIFMKVDNISSHIVDAVLNFAF